MWPIAMGLLLQEAKLSKSLTSPNPPLAIIGIEILFETLFINSVSNPLQVPHINRGK